MRCNLEEKNIKGIQPYQKIKNIRKQMKTFENRNRVRTLKQKCLWWTGIEIALFEITRVNCNSNVFEVSLKLKVKWGVKKYHKLRQISEFKFNRRFLLNPNLCYVRCSVLMRWFCSPLALMAIRILLVSGRRDSPF